MTDELDGGRDVDESLGRAATRTSETVGRIIGDSSLSAIFSEPHVMGEDLVFTAAAYERGGGFGFGAGRGDDGSGGSGGGGGGGGGGGSEGRPVAVIRVGPRGIEVKPVIDLTKIGVTFLLAAVGVGKALRRR